MRPLILALFATLSLFVSAPAFADNGAAAVEGHGNWHLHGLEDARWWFPPDWIKTDHDYGRVVPDRIGSKHHHPQQWAKVSASELSPRLRQSYIDRAVYYDILDEVKLDKITVPQIVVGKNYRYLGFADQQYLLDAVSQQYGLKRLEAKAIRITDPDGGKVAMFLPATGTLQQLTAESDRRESWFGRQWRLMNE